MLSDINRLKGHSLGLFNEFRQFAIKGNVDDMAVGLIIGAAFGKIVSSLVADIVMPPLGFLIGGVNFTGLVFELKYPTGTLAPVAVKYGQFIQTIIDKVINRMKRKEEIAPTEPPKPSNEEILLTEIRDLLARK